MQDSISNRGNRQIKVWLIVCAVLIFAMIVLGGVTRLTHSGLSMVDWKPILGAIPPLSEADWLHKFEQYQQFPEYKLVNRHISLEEFKTIFLFEYAHRLLGRIIGIVFILPFFYFLTTGHIKRKEFWKYMSLFLLGGLQGVVGWLMVKSGLLDKPAVSPYRLTIHLLIAIIIYGYILWLIFLQNKQQTRIALGRGTTMLARVILAVVVITIISGGFVAGTRAGFAFNTFPLMYGQFFPDGMFAMESFIRNFFENIATVQFNHRVLAYTLCILIPVFWLKSRRDTHSKHFRMTSNILLGVFVLQIILGISTLLLVVPVPLAAAHQANAVLLFTIIFYIHHLLSGCTLRNLSGQNNNRYDANADQSNCG